MPWPDNPWLQTCRMFRSGWTWLFCAGWGWSQWGSSATPTHRLAQPAHHIPLLGEPGVCGHHQGALHPPPQCLLLKPLHLKGYTRQGRGWTHLSCLTPMHFRGSCPTDQEDMPL